MAFIPETAATVLQMGDALEKKQKTLPRTWGARNPPHIHIFPKIKSTSLFFKFALSELLVCHQD
jgi:hypothetical protein